MGQPTGYQAEHCGSLVNRVSGSLSGDWCAIIRESYSKPLWPFQISRSPSFAKRESAVPLDRLPLEDQASGTTHRNVEEYYFKHPDALVMKTVDGILGAR
jgi:hypothetical protein